MVWVPLAGREIDAIKAASEQIGKPAVREAIRDALVPEILG